MSEVPVRTIVLFGEKPGPNTDPLRPLYPHTTTGAASRLIMLFGVNISEYLKHTSRYNVFRDERGPLTLEVARERVSRIHFKHMEMDPKTPFIFLGKSAIRCAPLKFRDLQFLQGEDNVYLIPHPSGQNRFYNDAEDKNRVSALLRKIWREHVAPPLLLR